MSWDSTHYQFSAEGIRITSYDDAGRKNHYPMMHLAARDSANNILGNEVFGIPVATAQAGWVQVSGDILELGSLNLFGDIQARFLSAVPPKIIH